MSCKCQACIRDRIMDSRPRWTLPPDEQVNLGNRQRDAALELARAIELLGYPAQNVGAVQFTFSNGEWQRIRDLARKVLGK